MKNRRAHICLPGRLFYTLIVGILLVTAGIHAASAAKHNGDQVLVTMGAYTIKLQRAIDSGFLARYANPTSSDTPSANTPYHMASQVLVIRNGFTMTLQEAYDNSLILNPASRSFTTSLPVGESASDINVYAKGEKTLQKALDDGSLCNPKTCAGLGFTCGSPPNGCGGTLSCPPCTQPNTACSNPSGGTCISTCAPSVSCGGTSCINAGTVQCDGSCAGTTYKAIGTYCGCTACLGNLCNGQGSCSGKSGHGCNACPFNPPGSMPDTTSPHRAGAIYEYVVCTADWSYNPKHPSSARCGHWYDCNCDWTGACQGCYEDLDWSFYWG